MGKLLLTGVDGNLGSQAAEYLLEMEPVDNLIFCGYSESALQKYADMGVETHVTNFNFSDGLQEAFAGADRPEPGQVYLGGGAGFVSKTVLYPLLGRTRGVETAADMFCKMGVPAAHGHDRDRQAGVSPHTMKGAWYQGQWMEMGKCRLEILDEEGGRQ